MKVHPNYEDTYHQISLDPCPFCGRSTWVDFLVGPQDPTAEPCPSIHPVYGHFHMITYGTMFRRRPLCTICECAKCGATASW